MLRADDVLAARFGQTQFAPGYDQREVDAFLDAAVDALRAHEAGTTGADTPTAADARAVRFTPTRLQRGYSMQDVDALVDRVAQALASYENGSAPSSASAPASGSDGAALPSAVTRPPESLGAKVLRVLRGDPRP